MKRPLIFLSVLITSLGFANSVNAAQSAVGSMVSNEGTVYMSLETIKRPYSSAAAFLSYKFNTWANVHIASAEDVALKTGDLIPPRDGSIICSDRGEDAGACYLITDSKKAKFSSEQVVNDLGYSLKESLKGDVSFLVSTTDITSGSEAHRVGTVINKANAFYLVGKNGLIGLPNESILNSSGYDLTDVVPANTGDLALAYKFDAEVRRSNELRPFEPTIPVSLEVKNEDKFSLPFKGPNLPVMTEGWLYSADERAIHGFTNHGGVDFAQPYGTPVYAVADGYSIASTHLSPLARTYEGKRVGFGLGEFIQIWHPAQGVFTSYSHLEKAESKIPYFAPVCKDGFCDPEVVYNDGEYSVNNGKFVKRGELIGYVGDSGLSWGYTEKPKGKRLNPLEYPSWDETHLHFEMYTRVGPNFGKTRRYDPFGIYGRLGQYTDMSYTSPNSLWKIDSSNRVEFAN